MSDRPDRATGRDAPAPPAAEGPFDLVAGVDGLRPVHGPIFAVVGVFDGLHLGHRWLLDALLVNAERLGARPAVITFDSHPDEVLVGAAPPLLLDPVDRLRLLRDAGVTVVVVQHFDAAVRRTPYDAFIRLITDRTRLAGLLMTPDAAFGHERRGTPDALAALGAASDPSFEVVVLPPFSVDGGPVSSSTIRRLVETGDLAAAGGLLGRPYGVAGEPLEPGPSPTGKGPVVLGFPLPVALPPIGTYDVSVVDADLPGPSFRATADVRHSPPSVAIHNVALPAARRLRVVFD